MKVANELSNTKETDSKMQNANLVDLTQNKEETIDNLSDRYGAFGNDYALKAGDIKIKVPNANYKKGKKIWKKNIANRMKKMSEAANILMKRSNRFKTEAAEITSR